MAEMTIGGPSSIEEPTPAKSRWAQIRAKKPTRPLKVPGTEIEVVLRVLTESELDEAHAAAYRYWEELYGKPAGSDFVINERFGQEQARQVLWRAMRDPEDLEQPSCPSVEEFRQAIDQDTLDFLFQQYDALRASCDPTIYELTEAELDELEELVKKKDRLRLSAFGSSILASFIISSAARSESSPSGTSSSSPGGDEAPTSE